MMAEMDNLKTASLYINNQLLSRGLLRDGSSIDFADPNGDPGGLPAAMARIMSVVNDLILERDVSNQTRTPYGGIGRRHSGFTDISTNGISVQYTA